MSTRPDSGIHRLATTAGAVGTGGRHTVAALVDAWARNAEIWANRAPPKANGKDAA
jgi:hypothetical protein